jgi:DNA-binding NtrC family response regulator
MGRHLFIVEDDPALNELLVIHFEGQGYQVSSALTIKATLAQLESVAPDLFVLDHRLPDGTGLDLLEKLRSLDSELPVIMMTGTHDLELAIQAIKRGAYDFIHKPVQVDELDHAVGRALERLRLARQVTALRNGDEAAAKRGEMLGRSRAMLAVSKEIALASETTASVLITGESGTGKELVARAIHVHSHRPGLFLAVNCAAIVDTLLESELFGHEKGAFTGAVVRKEGKFELASEGTLFLDEVGDLALPLQAKLLRVLQEYTFERLGGTQQLTTNTRIVAATNRDLAREVEEGRFREDLHYRLNVIHIHVPPLRERREDIPLLTQGLLEKISASLHKPPLQVTDEALKRLIAYSWPGNVRELENVLTQAMVRARDPILDPELLPALREIPDVDHLLPTPKEEGPLLSLEQVEAAHIQRVLRFTHGHKGRTCDILGISRPALDRKIKKYTLDLGVKDTEDVAGLS